MKHKIQIIIFLLFMIVFNSVSMAGIPVTCVNCSTMFTQELEYIKDIEQMLESIKRYTQLVMQTENAITNTMNLPTHLKSNLESQIRVATANIGRLNSYKADMGTLLTIFTKTWPELQNVKIDDILMQDRIEMQLKQFQRPLKKLTMFYSLIFSLPASSYKTCRIQGILIITWTIFFQQNRQTAGN